MNDFLVLHEQVFVNHPLIVLFVLVWGVWYMNYKARASKTDSSLTKRHEHKKRIWVGFVTLICALLVLPGVTSDLDAQQVRTTLTGSSQEPTLNRGVIDSPPEVFGPETVYDMQDKYLYSLLGNLKSEPDASQKLVPLITNLEIQMPVEILNVNKMVPKLVSDHDDTMALLDLMRDIPYASHGYIFQRPATKAFFTYFAWYIPRSSDARIVKSEFNSIEKANTENLEKFEGQHWFK